jgi:raffinose/stachyose/melibiose transport system permease protein
MMLRKHLGHGLVLGFLGVVLLMVLFPLLILGINAMKNEAEFYQTGPFRLPPRFHWEPLQKVIVTLGFFNRLWNSVLISVPTALFAIVLSLLNGYAIGIGRVRGKVFFLLFFLIAMMLPQEALIYPLYYLFRLVKLYNTRLGVILCLTAGHLSFGTYLLATVMEEFPRDFVDAAQIDGAGKIYVLTKIIVPLIMPTISVLFVFFFIWSWNDFFLSLIFLISEKVQTLPLGVLQMRGQYVTNINLQSAAALLLSLPCIIFFLIFQRTLTQGVMASGIKG